jgi:hypothetical protein
LTDPLTSIITSSALTLLCLRLIDAYRMHAPLDEQHGSQQKRKQNRTKTSESQEETNSRKSFRENFQYLEENEPQSIADVWTAAWAPFDSEKENKDSSGSPDDRSGQSASEHAQLMSLNTPLLYIQASFPSLCKCQLSLHLTCPYTFFCEL